MEGERRTRIITLEFALESGCRYIPSLSDPFSRFVVRIFFGGYLFGEYIFPRIFLEMKRNMLKGFENMVRKSANLIAVSL